MTERNDLWTCLECGRRFAKRNQWHSCRPQSVAQHFRDREPGLRETFDTLVARLREHGPVRIDAVASGINLASKHHFGGVSVRRDYLRVGFLAKDAISPARIVRTQRLGPNRVGHSVVLRGPADVDDQLIAWLNAAYDLQAG